MKSPFVVLTVMKGPFVTFAVMKGRPPQVDAASGFCRWCDLACPHDYR
jgi:hypothetical protein